MVGDGLEMNILAIGTDGTLYNESRSLEIHLLDELARQGHNVFVVCECEPFYRAGDKPELLRFVVAPVNDSRVGDLTDFVAKYGLMPPDKSDVVFCSSITGTNLALHYKKILGIPVVVQLLDIPIFRLKYRHHFEEWRIFLDQVKDADVLIANTMATKETLHRYFRGRVDNKVRLIYYGIDRIECDRVPDSEEKTVDILSCHRLVHHKATEKLIYALALLAKEGIRPVTVIIGEGMEMMKLIDLSAFAGVAVNFVGAVSDAEKYRLIKTSKVAVSTDVCNDIGTLFPLEAIYGGLPVICSDMMINRDRLRDWVEYVDAFDIAGLAAALKRYVVQNQVDRVGNVVMVRKPGSEAKQWVLENRTYEVQAKKTVEVFDELLGKSSG